MLSLLSETRPLLSNPNSPKNTSYLQPSPATHNHVIVSPQSGIQDQPTWPSHTATLVPRLHNLGWIEYFLPDGTVYYVHPTLRVTTDIDLRSIKKLDAVTAYFEHHKESAPQGIEMWLRDAGTAKRGLVPVVYWIEHSKRAVSIIGPHRANGGVGRIGLVDDDRELANGLPHGRLD